MSYPTGGMNPTSTGYNQTREKVPSGYKKYSISNFTPEQMDLFQQLFSHVDPESYLSRLAGGDQALFDEMEAPAFRQFNELMGEMGSRFSGMGMGARKGSGFNISGTTAASNFAQDLASKRQELQRQALMDLFNMSQQLMGERPYETGLMEKKKKGLGGWGGVGGAALGGAGGFLTGGPAGALAGAKLGHKAGSAFD